jgi:hypothetical protein
MQRLTQHRSLDSRIQTLSAGLQMADLPDQNHQRTYYAPTGDAQTITLGIQECANG